MGDNALALPYTGAKSAANRRIDGTRTRALEGCGEPMEILR
jgi:hypothetical protein